MHGILCNSHMHVGSGVLMFSVAIVWGKNEAVSSVDSIDSFGSEAHSIEVVSYGYVNPACFENLGCCGFEVKGEQCLDLLTVCDSTD